MLCPCNRRFPRFFFPVLGREKEKKKKKTHGLGPVYVGRARWMALAAVFLVMAYVHGSTNGLTLTAVATRLQEIVELL